MEITQKDAINKVSASKKSQITYLPPPHTNEEKTKLKRHIDDAFSTMRMFKLQISNWIDATNAAPLASSIVANFISSALTRAEKELLNSANSRGDDVIISSVSCKFLHNSLF